MIEKQFIQESIKRLRAKEHVRKNFEKAGIVDVDIQRTPIAMRIGIIAERIGLIIGKKGEKINKLSKDIETKLGMENPQIEVMEVRNPDLEPIVIARYVKRMIERGTRPRIVIKRAAERVMRAGAMGVEIITKGPSNKGMRSRKERVERGYLKKAGETSKQVKVAKLQAVLKQGVIGITVKIAPPEMILPDKIKIKKPGIEEIAEETVPTPEEEEAAEKEKAVGAVAEIAEEVKPTKAEEKTTKEALKEVAEKAVEEFKCEECGKSFKTKRGLTAHMRVHKK